MTTSNFEKVNGNFLDALTAFFEEKKMRLIGASIWPEQKKLAVRVSLEGQKNYGTSNREQKEQVREALQESLQKLANGFSNVENLEINVRPR